VTDGFRRKADSVCRSVRANFSFRRQTSSGRYAATFSLTRRRDPLCEQQTPAAPLRVLLRKHHARRAKRENLSYSGGADLHFAHRSAGGQLVSLKFEPMR